MKRVAQTTQRRGPDAIYFVLLPVLVGLAFFADFAVALPAEPLGAVLTPRAPPQGSVGAAWSGMLLSDRL